MYKVTPQAQGDSIKSLVNLYTLDKEDFEAQSIKVKKLFFKYKARRVVIDANGLGAGLVDEMIKDRIDPITGDTMCNFGVYNDEDGKYKKYRNENTVDEAMYLIKANAPINTEAHQIAQAQLSSGRVKFLIDERAAKVKLMGTKNGQGMSPEERNAYLRPYVLTSILRDQMMNLRQDNDGVNIILKQANKGIKKDKFSAFEYALYYIKQEEDSKRKRRSRNFSEYMFMS